MLSTYTHNSSNVSEVASTNVPTVLSNYKQKSKRPSEPFRVGMVRWLASKSSSLTTRTMLTFIARVGINGRVGTTNVAAQSMT